MEPETQYSDLAVQTAREAGEIIKRYFNSANLTIHTKRDNSLVTQADLDVSALVQKNLGTFTPNIPIICEETDSPRPNSELVWICDPLDGTAVFAHGIPTCAFSLALTRNGNSILGIIYDPFTDRMFVAQKNKGATMNEQPVHVSTEDKLLNTMMGMSWWAGSQYNFLPLIPSLRHAQVLPVNVFSTVYMSMLVASGQLSAVIYLDTHAYDVAALKVIIEEAGGKVTDLQGNEQRYDQPVKGCLITNGLLHETYIRLIQEAGIIPA